MCSRLLHHHSMMRIKHIRELRRQNLAALREKIGASRVATLTGIAPSQLYQMSLGKRGSARNINDEQARHIETACNKPAGWLDLDHSGKPEILVEMPTTADWPFKSIAYSRFRELSEEQKTGLEEMVATSIKAYEAANAASKKKRAAE